MADARLNGDGMPRPLKINRVTYLGRRYDVAWKHRRPWCRHCLASGFVLATRMVFGKERDCWAPCDKCPTEGEPWSIAKLNALLGRTKRIRLNRHDRTA
jgi:hypothetical protein